MIWGGKNPYFWRNTHISEWIEWSVSCLTNLLFPFNKIGNPKGLSSPFGVTSLHFSQSQIGRLGEVALSVYAFDIPRFPKFQGFAAWWNMRKSMKFYSKLRCSPSQNSSYRQKSNTRRLFISEASPTNGLFYCHISPFSGPSGGFGQETSSKLAMYWLPVWSQAMNWHIQRAMGWLDSCPAAHCQSSPWGSIFLLQERVPLFSLIHLKNNSPNIEKILLKMDNKIIKFVLQMCLRGFILVE